MTTCYTLCGGANTREINQMPASILHFLAISDDLFTHPRLSRFHVFDDGQNCSVRRRFQLLAVLQHHSLIVLMISLPLEAVPCLCLFTGLLLLFVQHHFCCRLLVTVLLIPVPLVVGIASATAPWLPQRPQGSSRF